MRNAIIAAIIAVSSVYLPFWQWDGTGDMIGAAVVIWQMAMLFLIGTEKGGDHEKNTGSNNKGKASGKRKCHAA